MNERKAKDGADQKPKAAGGSSRPAVTELLVEAQRGGAEGARATNELFPIVYEELRELAGRFMHDESRAQTLQATALVHEAYMRLVGPSQTPWESRAHFFGAAAQAIRRILIDHARTKCRAKRAGGKKPMALEEGLMLTTENPETLVEFDGVLSKLAEVDAQKARVVELRFFAGLTVEQTAMALGVSASTVARDWQFARVWLYNELKQSGEVDT